ncbi:DUF3263 domain-containing protein [Microbacterium sp. PA5]|uniref:DUF3263 domain-containing protein n=1 Tax=Microbacterium sp. PA5 TaxID=3416654 RepID=UPI003CECDD83
MRTGGARRPRPSIEELLDFEAAWPSHTAAKDEAIYHELGVGAARYDQLLHRAAASLDGQAHDPLTAHWVNRLRASSAHVLPTPALPGRPALSSVAP